MTLSTQAINLLRHNARSVVRELGLLNDAYFEIGVTLAERHLLIELSTCDSPTMGEIAERLLLEKSTVSRLIAKSVKKGYIQCKTDDKDRRKRFLQLTEKGKQTLHTFEPIAFNQTKEALLTLTPEEVNTVYQGIALYATGLKNARLKEIANPQQSDSQTTPSKRITLSFSEVSKRLHEHGCKLKTFEPKDKIELYNIFKDVVESGSQFPYECSSMKEFEKQFFHSNAQLYVCHTSDGKVIGGFYLRANFSGRSAHIANAAYMIDKHYRGKGIGTLMIQASLHIAKELGFQAMQFNMVLSNNTHAIKVYEKLGFTIVGTIPHAIRTPEGCYQDGYVMHRPLNDL